MGRLENGVWIDWIDKVKILQKAIIKNKDGLFLALKRPEDAHNRPNCWDLPGGSVELEQISNWKEKSGKGNENDILVKSLQEEINQETGLKVKNIEAIHTASGFNSKNQVFIIAIGYLCLTEETQIKLSSEHSEYKWVTLDEFMNLDIGDDGGLIISILEKVRR